MNTDTQIRLIRIAASAFLETDDSITLKQDNLSLYDFTVTSNDDFSFFKIKVLSSNDKSSALSYIKEEYSNSDDSNIIFIAFVNENRRSVSIIETNRYFSWDKDILPTPRPLNKGLLTEMFRKANNHYQTVRIISKKKFMFTKTIHLVKDMNRENCLIDIVYTRDLSDNYKEILDPNETIEQKFARLAFPKDESHYPKDELDTYILSAIKEKHPKAIVRTDTVVTNTKYRNLFIYDRYPQRTMYIKLTPDIRSLPNEIKNHLGKPSAVTLSMDVYIKSAKRPYAIARSCTYRVPLKDWFNDFPRLAMELSSYHSLSSVIK